MPVLDAFVKAPRLRAHPFPAPKNACPLRLLDSGSGTDSGFRDDTSGVELARANMSGLIGIHGSEVLRPNCGGVPMNRPFGSGVTQNAKSCSLVR